MEFECPVRAIVVALEFVRWIPSRIRFQFLYLLMMSIAKFSAFFGESEWIKRTAASKFLVAAYENLIFTADLPFFG